MKILESQSAVLSNYEVISHIQTTRAKPRSVPEKHTNVETVLKEIVDYLHPPPHSRSPIPPFTAAAYTPTAIRTLVESLQPFPLTKSEILMILNLRPLDLGLLDCVVEECDDRFTGQQQEEMLEIIGEVLGREPRVWGSGEEPRTNGVNGHANGHGGDGTGGER